MLKYLVFALLLATPAAAQQVTPSFGLDSSGSLRQLYVRDPTLPGFVPIGTLNTTSHTFTAAGAVDAAGAVAGGSGDATANTTAINTALIATASTGQCATGSGKSYRINGGVVLPDSGCLQDITLVQTGTTTTLTNSGGGTGPFTLRHVKIDYTAVPTTNGTITAPMGLHILAGHDIDIDGLEVTGKGQGIVIRFFNSTNIKIRRLNVHDIEWTSPTEPGGEKTSALTCDNCTDFQLDDFRIDNLWGSIPWTASTSLAGTQGLPWRTNAGKSYRASVFSGTTGTSAPTCTSGTCSDGSITWTYMGAYPAVHRAYQSDGITLINMLRASISNGIISRTWEGFDAAGVFNTNIYLSNVLYSDIDSWGEKWGHCVFNGGSIGSRVMRAGIAGFVVSSGQPGTDQCGPTHMRIVDSVSADSGSNGNWAGSSVIAGYRVLVSAAPGTQPPVDLRFVNPLATDDQAVHTMTNGFSTEIADPNAVVLINPQVKGNTGPAYVNVPSGMIEVLSADGSTRVSGRLSVIADPGVAELLQLRATNDTALGPSVFMQHIRPTSADGDGVGTIWFQGTDSAGNTTNYGTIVATAKTVADTAETGEIAFRVQAPGLGQVERLRVAAGVVVGGGSADPGAGNLRVAGGVQAGAVAVASLPTCNAAAEGMLRGVTDANSTTYNAVAVGGGANHMGVRCNATSWVLH